MSEPLRIALIAEGITDYDVIGATVASMLHGRSFNLKLLQPEESVAFTGSGHAGEFGGGWKGVYRWCRQAAARSEGHLRDDPLFLTYDLLLIHLDADVGNRLGQQPANQRFTKSHADYSARAPQIQAAWPSVVDQLSEARRFYSDFMDIILVTQ